MRTRREVKPYPDRKALRRFFIQVTVDDSGCWNSGAGPSKDGYVNFGWNGLETGAYRHAYQWFVGPIPPGFVLDHLCANRACVNPAHVEPVSQAENLRRGRERRLALLQAEEGVEVKTQVTLRRVG